MKRLVLILFLGSLVLTGKAETPVALAQPDEIIWFGIDYTYVKFIGNHGQFADLDKIRELYFRSWNELVMLEREKYDLNKAFLVPKITYDMDATIHRSQQIDMDNIVQTGPWSIGKVDVESVVRQTVDASSDKVGAMFVMETLNKMQEVSTMWLAVFKVNTGEILYMERYTGAVGGFGFRNYYARSYYNIIRNLRVSPRAPAQKQL